jgi:diacylglycerol kinase family enzyme
MLDPTIHQLRAQGHEANRYETHFNVAELASRALSDRCTVIVAFGGDGTVSTVAGVIFQSA